MTTRQKKYDDSTIVSETPLKLVDLIAQLQAALARVPAEDKDTAMVELEGGDYWCRISFAYHRMETEEEAQKRERDEARYKAEREDAERETFERLKRKFAG